MKQLLLAFVLYGLMYYSFEALFNWIEEALNSKITWIWKRKLKPLNAPSLWMIPTGALCGFIIHLWLMLPFNFSNIFIIILTCILGGAIITGIELASGLLLNIKMKLELWDYKTKINLFGKTIKLNYKGQIDVIHTIAWTLLTFIFIIIDKILF